MIYIGCDPARFGADDTAIVIRVDDVVEHIEIIHGNDTMEVAGRLANLLSKDQTAVAKVDEIGVGSGIVDRLKEQNHAVEGINVGRSATDKEHFFNLKAELYWNIRDIFKNREIDLSLITQEMYDRLSGELTSIKYNYTSRGQIKIEAKEATRKRIGKSPDVADALILAFCPTLDPEPDFEVMNINIPMR